MLTSSTYVFSRRLTLTPTHTNYIKYLNYLLTLTGVINYYIQLVVKNRPHGVH